MITRIMCALRLYRPTMRLLHRYGWHYAPGFQIEGDTQYWCQWCGLRYTVHTADGDRIAC